MRISDWSSDVCSSDLIGKAHIMLLAVPPDVEVQIFAERVHHGNAHAMQAARHLVGIVVRRVLELAAGVELGDRKSVVSGMSVSVRVGLGGCRIIKKKNNERRKNEQTENKKTCT